MPNQIRDLKTFQEHIKHGLANSSFETNGGYDRWRKVNEIQDGLQEPYRPKTILTFHGFVKKCPNDNTELKSEVVARRWEIFGLYEYIILTCSTCGYEYAKSRLIKELIP